MATTTHFETTIGRIAARQYGLVTRAQLATEGVSRHSLQRRIMAGRLVRAGKHVYALPGTPPSWDRSGLAACLDLGPDARLSHRSAAMVWELEVPASDVIDVTIPFGRRADRGSSKVVVHRSRTLTSDDGVFRRRLPVTSIARTLVDLAAILELGELGRCAHNALCRRLLTPTHLGATVDRLGGRGRAGIDHLRRVLVPWLAGDEVESVAEGEVWRVILGAGLPRPVTQHDVSTRDGRFIARVDFAWPDRQVALEVDGFRWHANPKSQVDDAARANRLAALGWIVLRTTPAEIAAGGLDVVAALWRHLGRSEPVARR